jgi:hypothetical protein
LLLAKTQYPVSNFPQNQDYNLMCTVVNCTKILQAAFVPISFAQKFETRTTRKKLQNTIEKKLLINYW